MSMFKGIEGARPSRFGQIPAAAAPRGAASGERWPERRRSAAQSPSPRTTGLPTSVCIGKAEFPHTRSARRRRQQGHVIVSAAAAASSARSLFVVPTFFLALVADLLPRTWLPASSPTPAPVIDLTAHDDNASGEATVGVDAAVGTGQQQDPVEDGDENPIAPVGQALVDELVDRICERFALSRNDLAKPGFKFVLPA